MLPSLLIDDILMIGDEIYLKDLVEIFWEFNVEMLFDILLLALLLAR